MATTQAEHNHDPKWITGNYILYTIQLYNRRWAHKHQIATLNKIDSSVWEAVSERDTGLTI